MCVQAMAKVVLVIADSNINKNAVFMYEYGPEQTS